MKNRQTLFILLFVAFAVNVAGQYHRNTTARLWSTDSTYDFSAAIRRYDIKFEYGKAVLLPQDSIFLDSLADFLHAHPELVIHIGVHGQLGVQGWGFYKTGKKARNIGAYLNNKGIPAEQLEMKGYGDEYALFEERDLRVAKTRKERDSLIDLNMRVEFNSTGIISKNQKLFSLADTALIPGSVFRNHTLEMLNSSMDRKDSLSLDSVVLFLKQHPSVALEVGSHIIKPSWEGSLQSSRQSARAICNYMISKGISKERLIPQAYSRSQPLHSEAEIKLKSVEEQEVLRRENKRVEFKIIATR